MNLNSIITLSLIFLLGSCSNPNSNSSEVAVSVPFDIDETLFTSQRNIDDCFNNLGDLNASAYIYENTSDLTFGGDGEIDDIDGNEPDPIFTVTITDLNNGIYNYIVEIEEPKSYRTAVTCQADIDNPDVDDNIRFVTSSTFFRVGDIPENLNETPFPDIHPSTTTDCLDCHRTTENYDVASVNHSFVQSGACIECHSANTM